MSSLTHITTQTISFVSHRYAEEQRPQPVRRGLRLPKRRTAVAVARNGPGSNNSIGRGKGMSWFHEMEEEVREYELDQIGVVNTAVYNNYCEYGTYKLLDMIGFEADTKLAVAEALFKYIAPLKRKDKYLLKSRIYNYSTTRLYCEYQIFKLPNHEPIMKSTATLVLIDESLRPCRIPPSTVSKFIHFLTSHSPLINPSFRPLE